MFNLQILLTDRLLIQYFSFPLFHEMFQYFWSYCIFVRFDVTLFLTAAVIIVNLSI